MAKADNEDMIKKCRDDLGKLGDQVVYLFASRTMFQRVRGVIRANPKLENWSLFCEWMDVNYVVSATVGVRRVLDLDVRKGPVGRKSISFPHLVRRICAISDAITCTWYASQYGGKYGSVRGRSDWKTFGFGRDGGDALDTDKLEAQLAQLRESAGAVIDYVDKLVAHLDRKPPMELPIYRQLHEVIGLIVELYQRLNLLLNSATLDVRLPDENEWDWVFRFPWIPGSTGEERL